jgi:DNA-binding NarL/FixJ family response regulator
MAPSACVSQEYAGNPATADRCEPATVEHSDGDHRARLEGVGIQPTRVVVVDDHPAIVDAIATAVRGAPDLSLAGTAGSLDAARDLLADAGPVDVVVADVQLDGDAEGLRLVDMCRPDGPAVLLLSSFDQPPLIRAAFERGAAGYLLKTSRVNDILAAIRTVAGGGTAFSATMLATVRSAPRRPSDREVEVLRLLCGGASNDEIGARLGVSEKTVESHLRRLFDRYGVLSRTELAVLALREGWVPEGSRR